MNSLNQMLFRTLSAVLPNSLKALAIRFDQSPLATVDDLAVFVRTRAAYIAQTSLYGYLKTRMGTQYAKLFQDETYVESINTAKWPIYAACLSDLTVFACASVARSASLDGQSATSLAEACYRQAADGGFDEAAMASQGEKAIRDFVARIGMTDWATAADGANAFSRSPQALVDHAPVVDEFRRLDADIVRNSVRFRWTDVRRQLRRRIDAAAIARDWTARADAG